MRQRERERERERERDIDSEREKEKHVEEVGETEREEEGERGECVSRMKAIKSRMQVNSRVALFALCGSIGCVSS